MQVALLLMLMVPGQVTGHADYLYWNARSDGWKVPVYLSEDVQGTEGITINDETLTVDPEAGSGVRARIGYQFTPSWEVSWVCTYFSTSGSDRLPEVSWTDLENEPTDGYYNVRFPWGGSGGTPETVTWSSFLRQNVHDIEFTYISHPSESLGVRLFGSVRRAEFHVERRLTFQPDSSLTTYPLGIETDWEVSNLAAYGLRFGTSGEWKIGGFSVFSMGAISALYGRTKDQYHQEYGWGGGARNHQRDFSGAIPAIELMVGASWTQGHLKVAAGYEAAIWFNVFPNAIWMTNSEDLILDGFFARVGVDW